jgi:hypothetical protein
MNDVACHAGRRTASAVAPEGGALRLGILQAKHRGGRHEMLDFPAKLHETSVCEIDDLSGAQTGEERRLPATLENMRRSLETYGLIIMRNAFDSAEIGELIENARIRSESIESAIRSGVELDPTFRVKKGGLAYDITAVDPNTAGGKSADFTETTIYAALVKTALYPILLEIVGRDGCWVGAKARNVIPGVEKGRNGQLGLHLEKRAFPYEGIHNIWTPLVKDGVITNSNAPGIQFFVGRLAFFQRLSPETDDEIVAFLRMLGKYVGSEKPGPNKYGYLYRPKLKAGDLALFSGFVPHAGCVPECAIRARVGFDVRIFPKCVAERVRPLRLGEVSI